LFFRLPLIPPHLVGWKIEILDGNDILPSTGVKSIENIAIGFPSKMLYLVGLGLADETDITVKGLEVVKRAERVYLEAYTSILLVSKEKLVSPL
jgi:hypothetical protein